MSVCEHDREHRDERVHVFVLGQVHARKNLRWIRFHFGNVHVLFQHFITVGAIELNWMKLACGFIAGRQLKNFLCVIDILVQNRLLWNHLKLWANHFSYITQTSANEKTIVELTLQKQLLTEFSIFLVFLRFLPFYMCSKFVSIILIFVFAPKKRNQFSDIIKLM